MYKRFLSQVVFTSAIAAIAFSGCSTKIPTKKLDYEAGYNVYKPSKVEKSTEEVIGIVDSTISQKSDSELFKKNNQVEKVKAALSTAVTEIISAKGFKLKGPYASFDDITYNDKKMIYLAFVPKIDLDIAVKDVKQVTERLYISQTGTVVINGKLSISSDEPMTGQSFIKKTINLSDLKIEEPFTYQVQYTTGDGSAIGKALDEAIAPKEIIDNTNLAVGQALNKFYNEAVKKIETYINKEEILSYKPDIEKLKGLKRF